MATSQKSLLRCLAVCADPQFCSEDEQFYDEWLQKILLYPFGHDNRNGLFPLNRTYVWQAWIVFRQLFVDEFINRRDREAGRWIAVPGMNPYEFPCQPGTVILKSSSTFGDVIFRRRSKSYFAGTLNDFFPSDLEKTEAIPHTVRTRGANYGVVSKAYRSENSGKAVIITADIQDIVEIGETFNKDHTYIDLGNFEFTNFDYKVCYVVTKVITAQSLKLEITHDGLVYYDLMYEGPRPICFQVSRVRLRGGTNGLIKSISPLTGSVPFYITGRRGWHNFFRSFVPNQEGLGNSSGDWSPTAAWMEPRAKQSFRPNYFSRLINSKKRPINIPFVTMTEFQRLLNRLESGELESPDDQNEDEKMPEEEESDA